MYKSPLDNFNDFYNQVFEKEKTSKQNNSKVEKSYFEYKNNQVYLRIKHDAINHGDKKHRLSAEEWKNVLENILNIENAAISNKQYSNDNVALIKVATPNDKYGVSIQFANGTNQISTIFKSTDKGIDSWIKKGSDNSSTSEPLTSRDNSHTVAVVGQNPNDIIAYIKEQLNPSRQDVYRTQNIQDNFGQSVEELQEMFSEDIKNILAENEINSDEFEIEDVRLYGSYTTGKNKDTSDLDVIVQYKGSMKEDAAFNLLNDAKLTITDVNGIERKIDINPINSRLSGSIDEHIERMQEIDGAYFQSAVTAGAETSAEISDAQKEWQEKGTDSKYFKKWFGDSKVVDENGKPLVVYHGTNADFDTFDYDKIGTNGTSEGVGFYFTDDIETAEGYKKQNGSLKKCYVSIQKPLGHDTHFLSYEDVKNIIQKTAELQSEEYEEELRDSFVSNYADTYSMDFEYAVEATADMIYSEDKNDTDILGEIAYSAGSEFANKAVKLVTGYDGVITNGYNNEGKGGGNFYIPFTSEQIKSVDNQGTFDEGNPNIYYQPAYHGSPAKFDKFDHDYIGSGEGAQVHGYGTYVAKDKNIADERYRKTLSDTIGIGTEILVDNVTYKKIATNTYKKKENIYDSVDDYLNEALNFIEIKGSKKKALKYVQEQIDNHKDAGYFDEAVYYIRIKDALNEIIKAKITKYADDYGQLYEVEIPEDEEMLDEDLPFSEQPQKVQDAFGEMIKADQNGQLILLDSDMDESETPITSLAIGEIVSENPNGKKIYDRISSTIADVYGVDYAEADKLASELLNRYGIKGIKYNGQTDGQCYVIFNPENIDITRTFYQEAISPKTSQKAKEVVNALKKIADGSEEETVKDLRNDLEQYGGTNDVTFVFGNDKKGIKHIAQKHGAKTLLKVFDTVVDGKVLRYVPNKKTVVLSKGDYEAVLSLDENGNKKTWLLSGWNTKEKSSGVSREVGTQSTSTQIKPTFSRQDLGAELNNSITNSDGDFNPKQSQKRTGYVFQEPAQPNLFVENASQNHNKGFVGIDLKGNRGLTDINRNLILIGTTGDVTTVLHESAHYFLNMLEELERVPDHSPKVDDVLFVIRKTLKNDGTPFTRSQHEKFAKGFEHYIYTGNARSNIFKEIYEDIKNLLKNIYEFVQKGQYFTTGEGALTEEEMKNFNNVFDEIFKLENKTVKERVFAKVLALDEKEEVEELTLFFSLFFAIQTPLPKFLI